MAFKINTITNLEYFPGLTRLNLVVNNLTNIDVSQNTNLEFLNIGDNLFTDGVVNNLVLPDSLFVLGLSGNQIINFNPVNALPNGLQSLYVDDNQIVTFNPTIALPSLLKNLGLSQNQIVTFNPLIALPGLLEQLLLSYNQIVTFNPSVALPISLNTLSLENNLMTTVGYTGSEPWANAMSVIPGRGDIYIGSNINSVIGTTLQTILNSKGWSLNV